MSWGAIAVGAGTAIAGYFGSRSSNNASRRASQGTGGVDISHDTEPWNPSYGHREDIMSIAQGLYGSRDERAAGGFNPGGGRRAGRGGGGAGKAPPVDVNSQSSRDIAMQLQGRADGGHPLYGVSNDYVTRLLGGEDDPNQYRSEAAGMFRDLNDPNLQKYIDMLFGDLQGGGDGAGGGGGSYNFSAGGGQADAPVGTAKYAKEILGGKYLDEGNPAQQRMLDSLTRRIKDDFSSETLPGINSEFSAANALGSNAFDEAYRRASQGYTDSLGDASTSVIYGDYNNRLNQIDQWGGIGAQLDMNAADNASRAAASAASAYGADRDASTRMSLARLSALGDAMGLSTGLTTARASGMAGLAGMLGDDQTAALGDIPELSGMDIRDLLAAFDTSHSMDELSQQEREAARTAAIARSGQGLARRSQMFDEWRYGQEAPWNDLARYGDLVNAMSQGYGVQHEYGTDRRNASPPSYSNPWQQALAGGLAGYGWGRQQGWGSGGATNAGTKG